MRSCEGEVEDGLEDVYGGVLGEGVSRVLKLR